MSEPQPPEQTPVGDEPAAIEPDAPTEASEALSAPTVVDQPSPVTEVAAAPEPPPAIAAAMEGKAVETPVAPPEPGDSVSTPPPPLPEPSAWTPPADDETGGPSGPAALAAERPEVAVGAAFAGGLVLALLLKRLAR